MPNTNLVNTGWPIGRPRYRSVFGNQDNKPGELIYATGLINLGAATVSSRLVYNNKSQNQNTRGGSRAALFEYFNRK
jgi:hypothetical protein